MQTLITYLFLRGGSCGPDDVVGLLSQNARVSSLYSWLCIPSLVLCSCDWCFCKPSRLSRVSARLMFDLTANMQYFFQIFAAIRRLICMLSLVLITHLCVSLVGHLLLHKNSNTRAIFRAVTRIMHGFQCIFFTAWFRVHTAPCTLKFSCLQVRVLCFFIVLS